MRDDKEENVPQDLFGRVTAFKEKYADLVNRVCDGMDRADIRLRSTCQDLCGSEVLRTFFNRLDATHPRSPVVISSQTFPAFKVTTGTGLSRVTLDADNYFLLNGFVQDWHPRFRDKLKKQIDARSLESGKLSPKEKGIVDTYVMMGDLIDGFKRDYLPLQKDIEKYRKLLDKQREQEAAVEQSNFARAVRESRERLGKERS
jgi:hypothetical protein